MQLFWEKGFECTSIQDLVDCMGIGRASLYDTFGSKEELMFEAMDCYVAQMKQHLLDRLRAEGPAPLIVRGLFEAMVERGFAGSTKSCLIAKSAMMTGRQNEEIRQRVVTFMNAVEDELHRVLSQGIEVGEIPAEKDPRDLARFLTTTMQGLSVTSTTRTNREELLGVVEVTLSVLR